MTCRTFLLLIKTVVNTLNKDDKFSVDFKLDRFFLYSNYIVKSDRSTSSSNVF